MWSLHALFLSFFAQNRLALIQSNIYDCTSFGHLESLSREQDTNISLYIYNTSNSRHFFHNIILKYKVDILYRHDFYLSDQFFLIFHFFFDAKRISITSYIYVWFKMTHANLYINPTKQNPIKNVRDSVESDL